MRRASSAGPATTNAQLQSASPNVAKIRRATGTYAAASVRAGSTTRQSWNIVDQSSSVRVTPALVVSLSAGSGFFATAQERSAGAYGSRPIDATADGER